jgi:hypothetical protein
MQTLTTPPTDACGATTRLGAAVEFVRGRDTAALWSLLLPGVGGPELRALVERCRFAHAGLLVFPTDPTTRRRGRAWSSAYGRPCDTGATPPIST